jgi:hypothetical protein
MTEPTRITWSDKAGQTWRVELVADRWQLARWRPATGDATRAVSTGETDEWQRVGSYPTRTAAVDAARAPDLDAQLEERDQLIRRLVDRGGRSEGPSNLDEASEPSEEGES